MKKSETNTCLIAGVLATSILLTGCGGGSGGGMSGLGATGATGTTGTTGGAGANGVTTNLVDLLGSSGGVTLAANALGEEGIVARALTPQDVADLNAAGILGTEGVEVLRRNGTIIGFESPTGSVFGVPVNGVLPSIGGTTLPALPTGIPRVGILGL
jgi:collagen type I alpha